MRPPHLVLAAIVPSLLAAVLPRQSLEAITDSLLFELSLADFLVRRDGRDPAALDWTSNGCSHSPDNPAGFPFEPACDRHDFGYRNYKAQGRLGDAERLRIDDRLRADLHAQCVGVEQTSMCDALAEAYYAAVRVFGGVSSDVEKVEVVQEELDLYREKVAVYEAVLNEARERGTVAALATR